MKECVQKSVFKPGDVIRSNIPKGVYGYKCAIPHSIEVYTVKSCDEDGVRLFGMSGVYFEHYFDLVTPVYLTKEEKTIFEEILDRCKKEKLEEKKKQEDKEIIEKAKKILDESGICDSCLREYDIKTKEQQT